MTKEPVQHKPFDIEVEQAVLGALIIDNSLIDAAAAELDPEHFYDGLHARLYEMIVHLQTEGSVTPLVIHSVMKTDPGLIEVGGLGYLVGLAEAAPAMPNIKDLTRILRDLFDRRRLIRIGEDLVNDAMEAPRQLNTAGAVSAAMDALSGVLSKGATKVEGLHDLVGMSLHAVEKQARQGVPIGVSTGSGLIDRAIGMLQPGDRLAICGRSGMGKSALAGMMSRQAAMEGKPCVVISADMSARQWANRMVCEYDAFRHPNLKPVAYSKFRKANFTDVEFERLVLANQHFVGWPIQICEEASITLSRIRALARSLAAKHPGVQGRLVVDFLQKVVPEQTRRDTRRDEDLTHIAYALGDIVKEIGWDLVALAQLKNKGVDTKGQLIDAPPNEADIRESGGIMMAMDIVFALHRKAYFLERSEPEGRNDVGGPPPKWLAWNSELRSCRNQARIIGFKNRDAALTPLNLDLWCDMAAGSFRDEAPDAMPEPVQQAQADMLAELV